MTLDEYQKAAIRTSGYSDNEAVRRLVLGCGIAGEAGEVADELKKVYGHGHGIDHTKLKKELGDVLWYAAVLANELGLSLSDVAAANIEKLRQRYPDGFSEERSRNRTEEVKKLAKAGTFADMLGQCPATKNGARCHKLNEHTTHHNTATGDTWE